MFKKFGKNFKNYFNYLMTVDFKELFVNTVILFCILVLAGFVFVPVGIVQDLIRNMLTMVNTFSVKGDQIFNFIFLFISTIGFFLAFIYLFNKRFDDIEAFKKQASTKSTKKTDNDEEEEEIDLPKSKNDK